MEYSDDEKLTGYEGMVGVVLYLRISVLRRIQKSEVSSILR